MLFSLIFSSRNTPFSLCFLLLLIQFLHLASSRIIGSSTMSLNGSLPGKFMKLQTWERGISLMRVCSLDSDSVVARGYLAQVCEL